MSSIAELTRLLEYYKAGGGRKSTAQEVMEGVSNIGDTLLGVRKNYLDQEKAKLENELKRKELEQGKSLSVLLGIPAQANQYEQNRQGALARSTAGVSPSTAGVAGMFQSGLNEGTVTSRPTVAPTKTAGQMFAEKTGLPEGYENLSPEQVVKISQAKAYESLIGQRNAKTALDTIPFNPKTGEVGTQIGGDFIPANSKQVSDFYKAKLGKPVAAYVDTSGNIFQEPGPGLIPLDSGKLVSLLSAKVRNGGNLDYTEKKFIDDATDGLRDKNYEARSAARAIGNISKLEGLINTAGVTGKLGQLKAFLAPYAGEDAKSFSEAQTYQLLARVANGNQRLALIGPGAVSDYEQELLNKLSGGGGVAKDAALALMDYYKNMNKQTIQSFNQTLNGISAVSPKSTAIYEPINLEGLERPPSRIINPFSPPPGKKSSSPKQTADDILKEFGI